MRKLMLVITTLYILSEAFDSVIRWAFDLMGVAELIYARDVGLIIIIVLGLADLSSRGRNISGIFWLLWTLTFLSCISLCSGLRILQLLFGLKIWLPFLAGYILVEGGMHRELDKRKAWLVLWGILSGGIILNNFIPYPWTGLTILIGDTSVSGNREWTADGVKRLSGFSRASFEGAMMVFMLYLYVLTVFRNTMLRIFAVLVSGVAIALTTSKGVVLIFASTLVLIPALNLVRKDRDWALGIFVSGLMLIALVGMVIPLVSMQLPLPQYREGTTESWLFGSFADRAWATWPQALALVTDWQTLLGRGIGGIGAAQVTFEASAFNPADNLFVYLYVTGGIIGAFIYWYFAFSIRRLSLHEPWDRLVYLVAISIFVYGLTSNILESAPTALVFGGAFYVLSSRRNTEDAAPQLESLSVTKAQSAD